MPGPAPKPPGARRRRNVAPGATTLRKVDDLEAPELPSRNWHELTRAWWKDVWASPMAPEYSEADVHGLFLLAALVDEFWTEPSQQLAAEIRLQRQCFGLTPIDRRRLQWTIERSEAAVEAGERRRAVSARSRSNDPRLKVMIPPESPKQKGAGRT